MTGQDLYDRLAPVVQPPVASLELPPATVGYSYTWETPEGTQAETGEIEAYSSGLAAQLGEVAANVEAYWLAWCDAYVG